MDSVPIDMPEAQNWQHSCANQPARPKASSDSKGDREDIRLCIDEKPDITIEKIREQLKLSPSYSTVERAIAAMEKLSGRFWKRKV